MKYFLTLSFSLIISILYAHNLSDGTVVLRHWYIPSEHRTVDGSFYMYKHGEVFIEKQSHGLMHYPLSALTKEDQTYVLNRYAQIEKLNNHRMFLQQTPTNLKPVYFERAILFSLLFLFGAFFYFAFSKKRNLKYAYPAFALLLMICAYSFTFKKPSPPPSTDPAFIDSAFIPFKPKVNTHWDNTYFYVESLGIPDHQMMTGITAWQQQVPIPQCYVGNNAWSIPLNPVVAATPVPTASHFFRGAIAIAANGLPIFNALTNTGVDAYLTGQLDNFGGHCGRADDYHYHIAPMFLDSQTPDILPIAFGLDGFAVYGSLEPDGSPMNPLDANHGHYGADGVYHYHGTSTYPYMIGNMVGQVTEDTTSQIIPQAAAHPVRPSLTPLNGAVITDCQPNGNGNGYILSYTVNGQNYSVDYNWNNNGLYTFHFNAPTGTTTETHNGFTQCTLPVSTNEASIRENQIQIYPNPASGSFTILLSKPEIGNEISGISIFSITGDLVYKTDHFIQKIETEGFAKGAYLVQIQFKGYQLTKKVIIQ